MSRFFQIRLEKEKGEVPVPGWRRRLPLCRYEAYLLKRLPVLAAEVQVMGIAGHSLVLPFGRELAEHGSKGFPMKFLNGLMKKYKMDTIYIEKQDQKYFEGYQASGGRLLSWLLLPETIEEAMREGKLLFRTLYPIVMDSGDSRTEGVLSWLALRLNHLIVLTGRPSFFDVFCETIYEETGLVAEIMTVPTEEVLPGNLVIDCGGCYTGEYRKLGQGVWAAAPEMTESAYAYLSARRKDLRIAAGCGAWTGGGRVDPELAEKLLCGENFRLRQFLLGRAALDYEEQAPEIKKRYDIRLENVKWLN